MAFNANNIQKILLSSVTLLLLTGCFNPVKQQHDELHSDLLHSDLIGAWKIVNIQGRVITSEQAELVFSAAGKVSGNSGCNQIMGTFKPVHDHLNLSSLASTKMLCAGAANADEQAFNQSLSNIEHFLVKDQQLFLTDEQDKTVIELSAE